MSASPSRLIALTKGMQALVDAEDYERLNAFVWKFGGRYAERNGRVNGKRVTVFMHRTVMGEPDAEVDHRNRNKLDNRKENLRLAEHAQNVANCGKRSHNTSGFKGVRAKRSKWAAEIRVEGKTLYLGTFVEKEAAARAYDQAATRHFGEFAGLNFPKE
jgi:hypothetical protein